MITRKKVFDFVKDEYEVVPDYPWETYSNYAALRHKDSRKWFGLVMDITSDKLGLQTEETVDVINLKVRKEFIGPLRKKEGIYPAYHMDKSNWITVNLKEVNTINQIKYLIVESYELTT
ncbi:MmcQ/YjbR family DNA-binding protein [Staphylococcus nepalensis]|uniref:MmcQ/YjbR family DNA-binding protein n=1 Tax=Staphylococcus nepalensis TaxID=214473 RepID=UPI001A986641|nr:MmcQ/YjbR family DNA-binding protein [Staphylococcus nepalensis]MBO1217508.1 MmcQ/YjbR family DNA-binding protein [Staphylococcus nepalensis]MBO1237234.1 MmcQ/YjbR family DNA-binding protein [Staphylococcus nepalensis]